MVKVKEGLSELDTLYKLMILYMLDKVGQAVTNAQIYDFMLGKEYTDYYNLNGIINEMINTGIIISEKKRNRSHLKITDQGREILGLFPERISPEIKKEITDYLIEKEYDLRNETAVFSRSYVNTSGDYTAEFSIRENNSDLFNLKLSFPDQASAEGACLKWEKNSKDIYETVMKKLL